MAKPKQRRRRKHRGTQGGRIDRAPRRRPQSRAEAKAQMRSRGKRGGGGNRKQSFQRGMRPPSWRSAVNRGAVAAAIFFAIIVLAFGRPWTEALTISTLMLLLYIPMGYAMDGLFYRRRMRQEQRKRQQGAGRSAS